jgi:hypothetical protein
MSEEKDTQPKRAIVWNVSDGTLEYFDLSPSFETYEIQWQTEINLKYPANKAGWKEHKGLSSDSLNTQQMPIQLVIVKHKKIDEIQVSHLLPQSNNECDFRSLQWIKGRYQLLKSCAQKATRLSRVDICLRSTWLVFCTQDSDMIEKWLRRWCIILAEDSMLHPVFAYFFFFQVAITRGWRLTDYAKFILLRGIESATQPEVPADWRCNFAVVSQTVKLARNDLVLISIIGRAGYGGMHGDMNLLYDLWLTWSKRLEGELALPPQWIVWTSNKWLSVDSNSLLLSQSSDFQWQFTTKDQLMTAVDMHCSSILVLLMEKCNIPEDDLTMLSSLIWDRRSSLRIRPCTCRQHVCDETIAPHKLPIQENDPVWWKSVMRVIDAFCANEWSQPTFIKSGGEAKTRAEILDAQVKQLRKKHNMNQEEEKDAKKQKTGPKSKLPPITNNKSLLSFFKPKQ